MHALKFAIVRTCFRLFSGRAVDCGAEGGSADAAGGDSTGSAISPMTSGAVSDGTVSPLTSSIGRRQNVEVPQILHERTSPSLTRYTSDSRSLCSINSRALQPQHC